MRILVFSICLCLLCGVAHGQHQLSQTQAERLYQKGSELVVHQNFGAARKVFADFLDEASPTDPRRGEAEYYVAFSALNLNHSDGEKLIDQYIARYPSSPKAATAYYDLALFFYNDNKFTKASQYFRKVDFPALTQAQQSEGHFKWGYSYFNQKQLEPALEQFNFVKNQSNAYSPAANYYAGFIEYSNGMYAEALADLKKAETNPSYASIVPYLIANVYYKKKRYDELLTYTASLKSRTGLQNMREISMLTAEAHYFKGDYEKAAVAYEEFLQTNPSAADGSLLFRAGYSNYALNKSDKAIAYLSKSAATRDSVSFYASYYLGITYLKTGEKPLALNAFDYSRRVPKDEKLAEEATFQFAKVAYDIGRTDQAVNELEKFLTTFRSSSRANEVKELLAQAYVNGNNFNKAIEYIESLPTKNPQVQAAYQKATYLLGAELFNKNNYDEAITLFEKSLGYPREPVYVALASFWAGECYSLRQRPEQAIRHYQKVISLGAQAEAGLAAQSRYGMGYAYFAMKDYDRALSNFREFTSGAGRNNPNYVDGLIRLADCYYVKKQYDVALTTYNNARNIGSPDNDYILLQTGMINGIRQNYAESRNHFTALITNYPKSPYRDEALFQRAQFEIEQGHYQASIDGLSQLIREGSNSHFLPYAYMRRASSYYNLKQYDKTIADYAAVIRQFPNQPAAQDALLPLQDALTQVGRAGEFDNYLSAFKRANPDNQGLEAIEFETAKNAFFGQQYPTAVVTFNNFINTYPQSSRLQEARYYLAESYYRMKEFSKALPLYESLSQDKNFNMGSRVVGRAAEIHFREGRYQSAIDYYHRLETLAGNKAEQYNAWAGLMDSFFMLQQYDSSDVYAQTILDRGAINAGGQNKASLYLGKSAFRRGDFETAKDEFLNTLNTAQDEYGAEAKYMLAQIFRQQKDYKQSYETLLSLTEDFAAYDEWVGKAYLLMADNFLATDEIFQARATLQSLVDNFPLQSIKDTAAGKLKEIDRMEAEKKKRLESDTLQVDTISN
ncbi:MAG: tetratricopeptide repeat protein [Bacteroidota bacterium]|nr:tetratricopeptide repeat protein [Bacteroidota bacterium]